MGRVGFEFCAAQVNGEDGKTAMSRKHATTNVFDQAQSVRCIVFWCQRQRETYHTLPKAEINCRIDRERPLAALG